MRRLRSWLPDETFTGLAVGNACALLAAKGPRPLGELATELHNQFGDGWATASGYPVQAHDVEHVLGALRHELTGLDLIHAGQDRAGTWSAGPSATSLLPPRHRPGRPLVHRNLRHTEPRPPSPSSPR